MSDENIITGDILAPDGPAQWIKNVNTDTFVKDVVEQSHTIPVIVDFWASWCGPCKQLTPILKKTVEAAQGRVHLVMVDIDQNQALAGQLRIQSVPTVMVFMGGQPVDGFQGALPESQVKAFIDKTLKDLPPSRNEQLIAAGRQAIEDKDYTSAIQYLGELVQNDPSHFEALGLLAQVYIKLGHLTEAEQLLETVASAGKKNIEVVSALAKLDILKQSKDLSGLDELFAKAKAEPANLTAQYELALGLHAHDELDKAADILLAIIEKDMGWSEGAAKTQLLKMFEASGQTSPFTLKYRRKLSYLLFC